MKNTLLALAAVLRSGAASAADSYVVDYEKSAVGFVATQSGREFSGAFERFTADILFSADDLENSKVVAEIDMASVDAGSGDRNEALPGRAWFDLKTHPKAVFASETFKTAPDGRYVAQGVLTMKGVSKPVALLFSLTEEGGVTKMQGTTTLVRTDFDVGSGQWSAGDTIGLEVKVVVSLTARLAG